MVWGSTVQYGDVLDWMGWDGPNEAGVATFQASTGQTRAPHSGQPICGRSGPFWGQDRSLKIQLDKESRSLEAYSMEIYWMGWDGMAANAMDSMDIRI